MNHLKTLSRTAMTASVSRLAASAALAVFALGAASSAYAADYNYEPELDAMYGQASFGASPIDIRFLPTLTITNSSLLSIDSEAEFDALSAIGGPSPTVSAFLINNVGYCGGPTTTADGCGETPGNILTFNYGVDAVVFAHELGHNLGLHHDDISPSNIMGSSSSGFDDRLFTGVQTATILSSPLVQTSVSGKFITIQLYNVVASVPEPSVAAMVTIGGLMCIGFLRKRKATTSTSVTATA